MARPLSLGELISLWEREGTPPDQLCQECPELLAQLNAVIQALQVIEGKRPGQERTSRGTGVEGGDRVTHLFEKWCALRNEGLELPADALCHDDPDLIGELTARIAKASSQTISMQVPPSESKTPVSTSTTDDTLGRYQLKQFLGKGGFGEVWEAYDPVLDKNVAIKRPRRDRTYSERQIEAFLKEARKAASLRHPGIVAVHNAERDVSGWYIVSDLVDGNSLRKHLIDHAFSAVESARLVAAIAEALHAAHLQGLIHRDIKFDNILIDRNQQPYLTDFGLAISEEEQVDERDLVAGTYAYMSPEQIRGESQHLDGRSDIYSLGVVLYRLLTKRLPFRAPDFAGYREQILERAPRPPRSIDDSIAEELERICLKCMAKDVTQRYTTAKDLASDLRQWLADQKTAEPAIDNLRRVSRTRRAAPYLAMGGGLLLLAWILWQISPGGRPNKVKPALGDAQPSVKLVSLLPPRQEEFGGWHVSKSNTVNVTSNGYTLLSFGDIANGDKEFVVQIRQPIPKGRIGVFFGYTPSALRERMQQYHVVQLTEVGASRYELRVSLMHARRWDLAGSHEEGLTTKIGLADFVLNGAKLGVRIQKGRLTAVLLNGQVVHDAAERHNRGIGEMLHSMEGAFGTYISNTSGTYAHPIVDGQAVRMADGSN